MSTTPDTSTGTSRPAPAPIFGVDPFTATSGPTGALSPHLRGRVITELGVCADIDVAAETERRIQFLVNYLRGSGANGYVLGISGGVDSSTAGKLAQIACDRVGAVFTAVRLPYGTQADEADAQRALTFIEPDEVRVVDIKPAVDAMHAATTPAGGYADAFRGDFVKGNIKARQRMIAQYALAGAVGALVIGTDHAAEAVMGFYTKFGDGACDLVPLSGLTKRQVRAIASYLGAPDELVFKTPTADLEDDRPQLPDEAAHGVTYDQIDDYLQGRGVDVDAAQIIENAYRATEHKRAQPVAPMPSPAGPRQA